MLVIAQLTRTTATGRCYGCGGVGHQARNCPTAAMLSAPRGPKACYKVRRRTSDLSEIVDRTANLELCSVLQCQQEGHVSTFSLVPSHLATSRLTLAFALSRSLASARPTLRRSRPLLSLRLPSAVAESGRHARRICLGFFSRLPLDRYVHSLVSAIPCVCLPATLSLDCISRKSSSP